MAFVLGSVAVAPMVARIPGLFIALGLILAVVLAVYAIYWLVFRMGK